MFFASHVAKTKQNWAENITKWLIHIWDSKQSALALAEKENEEFFLVILLLSLRCVIRCVVVLRWGTLRDLRDRHLYRSTQIHHTAVISSSAFVHLFSYHRRRTDHFSSFFTLCFSSVLLLRLLTSSCVYNLFSSSARSGLSAIQPRMTMIVVLYASAN